VRWREGLVIGVIGLLIGLVFATCVSGPAGADVLGPRRQAIRYVNQLRSTRDLPKLHWDKRLGPAATQHSEKMAMRDEIFHSGHLNRDFNEAVGEGNWDLGGENVGWSGSMGLRELLSAFKASDAHRHNMLRPRYENIGVGFARDRDGSLYLTYRFYG
jgi:uncharacterized protein YkwD